MSEDIQPTPPAPLESGQRETPKIYEACLNWEGTGDYSKRLVAFENYQELKRELAEAKAANDAYQPAGGAATSTTKTDGL